MNKIRTVSVFMFCAFLAQCAIAQNSATMMTYSLRQCVETAIASNLDVQQGNLVMQQRRIDWNQARLNLLPSVFGSASMDFTKGRNIDQATNTYINSKATYGNYGLSSDVVLFNGFYLQNSVKQNALSYEASRMDWQQAKDNVTIAVILAYLQVLNNEDLLVQARNQADVSQKDIERLEVMNKEGAIQPSQLTDLKGQFANDQLSIISTQNSLVSAKIDLCRLMNIPYDKNMQLERINAEAYATKYDETPESIFKVALDQFAQVKAADLRAQSAARAVKAARGQLFPTLGLGANIGTTYASTFTDPVTNQKISYTTQLRNNRSEAVGLSLRIPIFNSLFSQNRIKLAKLTQKNNELIAKTTKTQLQQSIELAHNNMTSSADRYKVLLEQVAAYNESFRAATIRFNNGLGTSVDYLTAKDNFDRANINLISAKYDYVLRTKILDYYQGKQLW